MAQARIRNGGARTVGRRTLLLATACLTSMAISASPTLAQDDDAAAEDRIVVTGTHIRGAELVGNRSLTIDSESLAASGKGTAADLLREIPTNFAGGVGISDESQSGQDAGPAQANLAGGQGVNLRGLGALSTLVLINGRRAPTSGQFGDFVDISTIPSAAIERVEILQDGASAVYGSDAVGGVVNFILKRQLDRPITTFRYGVATQGGGEELTASQLFGHNWDSGHAVFGAEYYHRDSVKATDRDRYANGSDFSARGGINWPLYSGHFGTTPNIYLGGVNGVSAPVGATVPIGSNASLTPGDLITVTDGVGNTTNVYEMSDILPETERYSLFASFDQELTPDINFFADVRYTDRESSYDLGYGVLNALSASPLPTTSPFYITGIDSSLTCVANTGPGPSGCATPGGGEIAVGVVIDDRVETRVSSVESYGGQVGLDFALYGDWRLNTILSYGRDHQNRRRHQLANVPVGGAINAVNCALQGPATTNAACAALGLQPLNPFSTDPLSESQLDEIFGYEDLSFDSYVVEGSMKVDGTLFDLPAGGLKLAAGVDLRREFIDGFLEWNTGSIETRTGPYSETERDAIAAFFEFAIPVHETFDVSVAGRYEEFSGTGDYNSFNPKIGANWRPVDGFTLRGSWGTSFHAPPMRFENADPQPLPGGNAAFILPSSWAGPCDSTAVTFNGLIGTPGTAGQMCTFSVIINSGGAGPGVLSPEEAETWTLGFDIEPASLPGFRASVGYFNIEVTDRIQRIQSATLPAILIEYFATGGGPFVSALNVNPTEAEAQALISSGKFLGTFGPPAFNTASDIQMIINATQTNIAALNESGFDLSVSYDFQAGETDIGLFAYGTLLQTYELQSGRGAAFIDQLGKYSSFGAPVALRSKQGVRFANGAFDGVVTVNYTDDYECAVGSCLVPHATTGAPVANTSPVPIDSWVTVDLNLGLDLSDFVSFGSGTRLGLSVSNLFDEEAPFLDGGSALDDAIPSAYDPNNATLIGRTVAVTLTREW